MHIQHLATAIVLAVSLSGCGDKAADPAPGATVSLAEGGAAPAERTAGASRIEGGVTSIDAALAEARDMPGDFEGRSAFDLAAAERPAEKAQRPAPAPRAAGPATARLGGAAGSAELLDQDDSVTSGG